MTEVAPNPLAVFNANSNSNVQSKKIAVSTVYDKILEKLKNIEKITEINPLNYDIVMLHYMDILVKIYNQFEILTPSCKEVFIKFIKNINTVVIDGDYYDYNIIHLLYHTNKGYNNIFNMFENLTKLSIININFPLNIKLNLRQFINLDSLSIVNCNNIENLYLPSELKIINIDKCNLKEIPLCILFQNSLEQLYLKNNKITYLNPLIKEMTNLKILSLMNNELKKLPDVFKNMINLHCLAISNNNFEDFYIDHKITNCIKLTHLLVNNCNIKGVDKTIGNLINLEVLDFGSNPSIVTLPCEMKTLKKLKNVNLDNIGLTMFPECITEMYNIERLRISNNSLMLIPDNIENWKCIKSLNLIGCNVHFITPKIGTLQTLTELFININNLVNIPREMENLVNLKYLDLSDNQFTLFPEIFTNMKQLIVLNLFNNNITNISDNIMNASNLQQFNIEDNPITVVSPNAHKFIDAIFNKKSVVNDLQNIHTSSVQKNTIKSIENIMRVVGVINHTNIIDISQIMSDKVLTVECKNMISKEFHKNEVLMAVNMTFKQLFLMVWKYIHMDSVFTVDVQNEIKKILSVDMVGSKDLCFVGKITRLIGCLNGFSDLVQITISEAEEIGMIISKIEKNLVAKGDYTPEKHYELALEELRQMGFNEETIQEWVQYIIA